MRGIDISHKPPTVIWKNSTTISIRLVGEAAMRRDHITRMIRSHKEAENQLCADGGLSLLCSDLENIGDEWENKREDPPHVAAKSHYLI